MAKLSTKLEYLSHKACDICIALRLWSLDTFIRTERCTWVFENKSYCRLPWISYCNGISNKESTNLKNPHSRSQEPLLATVKRDKLAVAFFGHTSRHSTLYKTILQSWRPRKSWSHNIKSWTPDLLNTAKKCGEECRSLPPSDPLNDVLVLGMSEWVNSSHWFSGVCEDTEDGNFQSTPMLWQLAIGRKK